VTDLNSEPWPHQIFGFSCEESRARVVLVPVPFEATVSYRRGTSNGPTAILAASSQLDLDDVEVGSLEGEGVFLLPQDPRIVRLNQEASVAANRVIQAWEAESPLDSPPLESDRQEVNRASREVNEIVYSAVRTRLERETVVGALGGDHSKPTWSILVLWEFFRSTPTQICA
jgi:agmatinase